MAGARTDTWATMERDWDDLCEAWSRQPAPPAWRALLPEHALPEDSLESNMLSHLCESVSNGDDTVTLALLRLAQAGHTVAGRVLVHAMMPQLRYIARRDTKNEFDDYIGAAWIRLMTFPARKRRQRVLANLSLDCLKMLSRQASKSKLAVLVDSTIMSIIFAIPSRNILESPEDTCAYVKALLDLAVSSQMVSETCVKVVTSIYCDGLTGREAATHHEISYDMVRYYCCSLAKKLRANRNELIEQLGPPQ